MVKRYDLDIQSQQDACIEPIKDGQFVKYATYKTLQKRCNKLEEFVDEVISALGCTDGDDIRAHLDEPLKELRGNYNG